MQEEFKSNFLPTMAEINLGIVVLSFNFLSHLLASSVRVSIIKIKLPSIRKYFPAAFEGLLAVCGSRHSEPTTRPERKKCIKFPAYLGAIPYWRSVARNFHINEDDLRPLLL